MAGRFLSSVTETVRFCDILGLGVIVSLIYTAYSDIATRTISNRVVVIVMSLGLLARLLNGLPAVAVSVAASLALFVFLLLLHARGMLGGGDVKLIPAVALGLSLTSINRFVFITVMAGGVLAVLHLIARWLLRGGRPIAPPPRGASLLRRVACVERWRIARHGSLPYGVAIACGGIWVIMSKAGS